MTSNCHSFGECHDFIRSASFKLTMLFVQMMKLLCILLLATLLSINCSAVGFKRSHLRSRPAERFLGHSRLDPAATTKDSTSSSDADITSDPGSKFFSE